MQTEKIDDRQRLMTVREVSARIGERRRWVLRRATAGAWGAVRIGGAWLFRRELVEAWLASEPVPVTSAERAAA